jgi:hypothetical protein
MIVIFSFPCSQGREIIVVSLSRTARFRPDGANPLGGVGPEKEVTMKIGLNGIMVLCVVLTAFGSVQADDNYGAIAYSESTGNWGYSYDYGSRAQAENSALGRCGRGDCEIKVWFKNSCGALAKASNGALGWSYAADSRAEAESLALSECRSRGSNCRILCWTCTSR